MRTFPSYFGYIVPVVMTCFFIVSISLQPARGQSVFTITGYQKDANVKNQYDIFGSNLSAVTNLTYSPFSYRGDSNYPVSFTAVSNGELTFSFGPDLNSEVDFIFSNSTYSDLEVTLTQTGFPSLTVVGAGQSDVENGSGGQRVLVLSGGTFGNPEGGSNVVFIEGGGTLSGFAGGGSNTVYYEPGALINNGSVGGGGGNILKEVNSINELAVEVPEAPTSQILFSVMSLLFLLRLITSPRPANAVEVA